MEESKAKIRNFLSMFIRNHDLRDGDDIFSLGLVNSLLAMQLVAFVEKEFDIAVADEDLDIENFRSVDAIADFIGRKAALPAVR
jgi:acyl carrier protein